MAFTEASACQQSSLQYPRLQPGDDLRKALHLHCGDHLLRILLPIPGLESAWSRLICQEQPQVEDISADYRLYFSEPMGYIHLALIVLCAYVIVHLGRLIAHNCFLAQGFISRSSSPIPF